MLDSEDPGLKAPSQPVLFDAQQTVFSSGGAPYVDHIGDHIEGSPRIYVEIEIGDERRMAVIDTGGVFFICPPDLAEELARSHPEIDKREVRIRGEKYTGILTRLEVVFLASEGRSLRREVTAFLPTIDASQMWVLPESVAMAGYQGCLEFMRFAVSPERERPMFYFGVSGGEDQGI